MVYSIHDPKKVAIQKMIEASRELITPHNNPAVNRDLEISTLLNAPKDLQALEALLAKKEKEKHHAHTTIETQKLCTEIEMLAVLRYLLKKS